MRALGFQPLVFLSDVFYDKPNGGFGLGEFGGIFEDQVASLSIILNAIMPRFKKSNLTGDSKMS